MKEIKTKNQNTEPRNSAIEALRVLAMLLIVLSHACVHSGFKSLVPGSFNSLFVKWGMLGNLGVDIFVLISGYYICQKKNCCRAIINLLLQVWFYSLLLFAVSWTLFDYEYTLKGYFQVFFPTVFREYWFFTAYIFLLLLVPYLNLLLGKMKRDMLKKTIIVTIALFSAIPTVTLKNLYGGAVSQFAFLVLLYLVGAYFRLYPDNFFVSKTKRKLFVIISLLLLFGSTVVFDMLSKTTPELKNKGTILYSRHSLLVIGCAVGLFATAISRKPFHNKFINILGSCTFGVYLIHENPAIRDILWIRILRNAEYQTSPFLALRIIISVLFVFLVCIVIEYLRKLYLEPRIQKLANPVAEKIQKYVRRSSVKN